MAYTTTELLAAIRRRGRLSVSDPDYTDANLLLEADAQLDETLIPLVLSARSDYYVRTADQAIVADQQAYPLPSRAVANVARQVYLVDANGETTSLPFLPLGDIHLFSSSGAPAAYTVRDDEILLLPTPSSAADTLRIAYEYQPGQLIAVADAMLVSSIANTPDIDSDDVPTDYTTSLTYDVIKGTSPFAMLACDLAASAVNTGASGDITFAAADIPGRLAAGDWIVEAGQTPVPQIPADLHATLALAVAVEIMSQMGSPRLMQEQARLDRALSSAQRKLSPRVKGSPQKIVSRNSPLRTRGRRRHRWPAPVS